MHPRRPDLWFFDETGLMYRVWFSPHELSRSPWHDPRQMTVCFERVLGGWYGSVVVPHDWTLERIGISGLQSLFASICSPG
jgi:hypothetical protein